jgi:DNA-directed RNA polymerase subunit H (RpoH/RPB5)
MADLYLNNLIYKSRKNILEMIEERGFSTSKINRFTEDEVNLQVDNHLKGGFTTSSNLSSLDIFVKNAETGEKLVVKYKLDDKFKKSKKLLTQLDEIYDKYELTRTDCVIIFNVDIVLNEEVKSNNVLVRFINDLYSNGKFVQFYGLQNFLFNISKHIYVPKHRIIKSKSEIIELTKNFHTDINKLPRILREDPMAKFIGAKPGDLIYIKGLNETTGFVNKYRICVESA